MTSLAARQTVNAARNIGKLTTANTAFLLCDVQDRFRTIIHKMETVIGTSAFLMNAAKGLDIPIVATEQYPKGKVVKCHFTEGIQTAFTETAFTELSLTHLLTSSQ